ncbi:MAG: glycosyltransferase [Bryobacteraceae bacterium]
MLLSVLIPVYNERAVVERCLAHVLSAPLPENMERELIVVDDCSSDGTSSVLERLAASEPCIRLYRQSVNQGKGAAVRTAIEHARGDFCLIQDADLEYDPAEYPRLLQPLLDGHADAVFGSRYLAGAQMRVLPFWHSVINKTLTGVSNMFSDLSLTDMETCYKVFRTDLLKSIPIRSQRFGIEPELTMKAAKRKLRIYEVPISYHGRTWEEGKKIGWKDGLQALGVILHFWLIDDLYAQPYGRAFLNNLEGTPQYLNWMAELLRPYLGDRILEIGAGIGTLSGSLIGRRLAYVATERDPLYLHALHNRFLRTPNVSVREFDPDQPSLTHNLSEPFDTVLCINLLEYVDAPAFLRQVFDWMKPGGTLIALVPQGPALFGSLDRTLGHKRRYGAAQLRALLSEYGFEVVRTRQLNKVAAPSWWLFSRLLGRREINKLTLKIFDKTVWLWRRIDFLLPWRGLSLVAIAKKPGAAAEDRAP